MKKKHQYNNVKLIGLAVIYSFILAFGQPLPVQAVMDPYEPQDTVPSEQTAAPVLPLMEGVQVDTQTDFAAADEKIEPAIPQPLTTIEMQARREAARQNSAAEGIITLEQAINMALQESATVRKADEEVKKQWELREDSIEALKAYSDNLPGMAANIAASQGLPPVPPVLSAIMDEMDPLTEINMGKAAVADSQYFLSKHGLTSAQDKVILSTADMYWSVLKNQQKVNLAKISLAVAHQQMTNSRLAYQVGQITHIMQTGSETAYQGARAQLEAAQNELDQSVAGLKQQLGVHQTQDIVLADKIPYQPLSQVNLETEVAHVLQEAPEVAQTKELVNLQSYVQDMTFYSTSTGGYRPYEVRKIEVRQAGLTVEETRKIFANITRNIYYGLRSLEEGYQATGERVKAMEEALRNKQLMYQQGMITLADLSKSEQELAQAKYDLFEMAYRHAVLEMTFYKPWAASGK